jgi:hypothetical protein
LQLIVVLLKEAFYHAVGTRNNDAHRLFEVIPRRLHDLKNTVKPFPDAKRNGLTYYEYVIYLEVVMYLFGILTGHKENHVDTIFMSNPAIPKQQLKVVTIRELGHLISKGVSLPQATIV